jgi:hypothetical protein
MIWDSNVIKTMGLISQEVYDDVGALKYFKENPQDMVVNGITYKVIDSTSDSSLSGFQALLLQQEGTHEYVLAFRGTELNKSLPDDITDILAGIANINFQYDNAVEFLNKVMDEVPGLSFSNLTLTGHSLGGILTQQVGAAFGIKGYTYNPWGSNALVKYPINGTLNVLARVLEAAGVYTSSAESFAKNNIVNVSYNDLGMLNGDFLSNLITGLVSDHLGGYLPIFGPDVGFGGGHSILQLNPAIAHYNDLLTHFNSDTTYNKISAAYVSIGNYEKTEKIFNDVGVYQASGLKFNFLNDDSASQIASKAKSDKAVLYALAKLNPFAIEGNLPAYANLNRTDMTDKYIEDRAQYLYYLLDKTNRYDVDPTLSMTWYEDAALGSDYTLKQSFSRSRVLFGGEGYSTLNGGDNGDHLYGMGGDDTLTGNGGDDYIEGGKGYDKYITGNGDTIKDSDNSGRVLFEGFKLTGGVSETGCKPDGSGEYKGDGGVYKLSGGKLTFTKDGTNETLIIEKFVNGALGIILTSDNPGGSCPPPIPNPEPPVPGPNTPSTPNPNFPSPLVLDLNGDGVTSTFISETSTYFDLDNDGVRQRTGWVQGEDGILVFDKNRDGKVNNGTELFGNHTLLKNGTKAANGFEALREYDENKDGIIDAKDNIYNTLSLWQDSNSDGVTDTGELHTLTELGVKSINLDYIQTTDYEEQNRIFQTSSFTTTAGDTQSINDVWFATESRDTARDTTVALKDTVAALPDFRGAGRAGNLSAAMNEIKIEREVA